MNFKTKRAALIDYLLKGNTLNCSKSLRVLGLSNPAREVARSVEIPFGIKLHRKRIETKTKYTTSHHYEYLLVLSEVPRETIVKMKQYVDENTINEKPVTTSTLF